MDKAYWTVFARRFLVEELPGPLTRASPHLQLFDNYIPNTRMRIRSIRVPETKAWLHLLQQIHYPTAEDAATSRVAQIVLDEAEYAQFQIFEGEEIRKNRYEYEDDGRDVMIDVHLGDLWGLNIARVEFADHAEMRGFATPVFAVAEVTGHPFFSGPALVGKTFADVQLAAADLEQLN